MIRAVFLDFYGTLAGWQPAPEQIQRDACAAERISAEPAAVARAYPAANAYMDAENTKRPISGRPMAERDAFFAEYERRILVGAGVAVPLDVAARVWARVAATPKSLALYPDSLPAVQALHAAGLTLGIISNMGLELHRMAREMGLAPFVPVCVTSVESGASKPHAAIFQAALTAARVPPEHALHVGDGYEADVLGARAAGLHALFINRKGTSTPADVPAVTSLAQVLPYLRQQQLVA